MKHFKNSTWDSCEALFFLPFLVKIKHILMFFLIFGCGMSGDKNTSSENSSETTPEQKLITETYLNNSNTTLKVNVIYELGAEPYVGSLQIINETWDVTQKSLEDIFSSKTIESPSVLSEMVSISSQGKSSWSSSELVSLGNSHAPALKEGNKANLTVIFLQGLFNGSSNVLGVHVTGTRFVFVFKDVVEGIGGTSDQQKYVEQATVVHELGHLIGLVNNGIPQTVAHEDLNHPHHTSNDECVMFWAIENPNQILPLLSNVITSNQLSLFKNEVKNDVSSYPE